MRDVSGKSTTLRTADAKAVLRVSPSTIDLIREHRTPKGNAQEVAKVAAIQAAKNTSQIIPYCHPIPVEFVSVDFKFTQNTVEITTSVKTVYKTGVEMEALTAASVAALTIYDMLKMVDEEMQIEAVTLLKKTGGKSDMASKHRKKGSDHAGSIPRAVVLVMSDSVARGEKKDQSGAFIKERLEQEGFEVVELKVVTDDADEIVENIVRATDKLKVNLVVTTGGTGIGPRDNTPEALSQLLEKDLPGVEEAIRSYGQDRNPMAMLSRSRVGVRKQTLIVALPGSRGGVEDGLNSMFPAINHAFEMLAGQCHPAQDKERAKR